MIGWYKTGEVIETTKKALTIANLPPDEHLKVAACLEMIERNYHKPMEAKWIGECCSRCGTSQYNWLNGKPFGEWRYCPGCGAKMFE